MSVGFPCYTVSFECECSAQASLERIAHVVANRNNNLNVVRDDHPSTHRLMLSASTGGYFYHNSFLPIVEIDIRPSDPYALCVMTFELKKSVKVLMTIFAVFAVLFEALLFVSWLTGQLVTPFLLCIPVGMLLWICLLSSIGLKLSSKRLLKLLYEAITQTHTEDPPAMSKC